jgi:hypothetical protein
MPITIETLRQKASARAYMWEVRIFNPPALAAASEVINLRCTTLEPPKPTITAIRTEIRGFTIPEAGAVEWANIAFTCVETAEYELYQALYNTFLLTADPITGAHSEAYAAPTSNSDITIHMLGLDKGPRMNWALHGCVLVDEVGFAALSNTKEAVHEMTFNVAYAYATLT